MKKRSTDYTDDTKGKTHPLTPSQEGEKRGGEVGNSETGITNLITNQKKKVGNNVNVNKNSELDKNEIWLDVNTITNLLGISKQAVQKNCGSDKYVIRQAPSRGKKGWKYQVALSSLPVEARARYFRDGETERLRDGETEGLRDKEIMRAAGKGPSRKALARYDFVKLYTEAANAAYGRRVQAKEDFITLYNRKEFKDLYRILGHVSYATAERWRRDAERYGPDGLEDRYTTPAVSSITPQQAEVLLKHYLSPNMLPLSETVRLARKAMRARKIPAGQSDITFRRYIEKWARRNHDLLTFARYGEKGHNDLAMPFINRDSDKIEVGDILVADGHTLNFEILNPFTGKPKRMTLIGFMDMKSRMPVGFEIMPTENTMAIASALRRSILNMGFTPRVVYLDNGRAFRGKYFTSNLKQSGIPGLFERLHINTIIAEPYHGQSKPIERFFGTFGGFERQMVSYTGYNIDNKPARMKRNEKAHKAAYERLTQGAAPDAYGVMQMIRQWIEEYALEPMKDGQYKGRKPIEVYQESLARVKQQADFKARQMDKEGLDFLMMESEPRQIQRNGIRFNNEYYWNEALYGRRHKVTVKYDLWDRERLLVYGPENEFICEAVIPQRVHPAAELLGAEGDREEYERQLRAHRRLKGETRRQVKALLDEQGTEAHNPEPDNKDKLLHQYSEYALERRDEQSDENETPIFQWEYERDAWLAEREKKTHPLAPSQEGEKKKKAN